MKYDVRKEVIGKNGKYKIVGERITADIRFEISAYGGSTKGKEVLDHLVYEGVLGDLIKTGCVDLCTCTHVSLIGFSFVDEKTDNNRQMGKILDINENTPHKVSEVICVGCGKRWIAVRPSTTLLKDLECPQCHKQGLVIETGEEINKEEDA